MLSSYLKKTILEFCSPIRKQVAAAGDVVTPADAFMNACKNTLKVKLFISNGGFNFPFKSQVRLSNADE